VLTSFLGPTLGKNARDVLNANGIVNLNYPEQIASVFSVITQVPKIEVPTLTSIHPKEKFSFSAGILNQDIGLKLISSYGFNVPASSYITSMDHQPIELSFPVVAKIDHPEILHKSDVGGVVLNIDSTETLETVLKDFFTRFEGLHGVIVQEQIQGDIELLLGATHESQTGHSIFVGLGGIFVEILKDYAIGHVPVNAEQIYDMIESLKAYPLLQGYRGQEGIDIDQLAQMVMNLNQLLLDYPDIKEMDLNPLKYDPKRKKLFVVDTVISL
jgi:acetyltransferase